MKEAIITSRILNTMALSYTVTQYVRRTKETTQIINEILFSISYQLLLPSQKMHLFWQLNVPVQEIGVFR